MKIHYVTSNKGKFDEAAVILQLESLLEAGFQIVHTPLHLEEIQGTSHEIASHKIKDAYKKLNEPCIIDDISLNCPSIGGLPGPYIRSFLEAIGDEGIAKLISHYSDRSCQVVCNIAFAMQEGESMIFEGQLSGTIVPPRGKRMTHAYSWNAIVQPDGHLQTFAELPLEEVSKISARALALTQLRNYLINI